MPFDSSDDLLVAFSVNFIAAPLTKRPVLINRPSHGSLCSTFSFSLLHVREDWLLVRGHSPNRRTQTFCTLMPTDLLCIKVGRSIRKEGASVVIALANCALVSRPAAESATFDFYFLLLRSRRPVRPDHDDDNSQTNRHNLSIDTHWLHNSRMSSSVRTRFPLSFPSSSSSSALHFFCQFLDFLHNTFHSIKWPLRRVCTFTSRFLFFLRIDLLATRFFRAAFHLPHHFFFFMKEFLIV